MKKLLIILICLLSFQCNIFADLGNCLIYEAKFYLKNGTIFKASIPIFSEGDEAYLDKVGKNKYTSDEGIRLLITDLVSSNYLANVSFKDKGFSNKVLVYKNLEELPLIKLGEKYKSNFYSTIYGFVQEENAVYVDTADIEKVIYWSVKESKREWLTSPIIKTSRKMIQTVKNQQYWNRFKMTWHPEKDSIIFIKNFGYGGYDLVNYNSKINEEELKRLAINKLDHLWDDNYENFILKKYNLDRSVYSDYSTISEDLYKYQELYFQEICDWFAKKGILLVSTWETC